MTENITYTMNELDHAIDALLPTYPNITPTKLNPIRPALLKIIAEDFFLNRFDLSKPDVIHYLNMCRAAMMDLHEHGHFVFVDGE